MYNYNLINPINITYRNPKQSPYTAREKDESAGADNSAQKPITLDENRGGQRQFPNGNKVQVDYTKNKVNIAQVIEDFKSTIAAINAPKEVSDEVYLYLNLVEGESKKENPSREIILSNLKNASKISDKFIEDSLKKPSTVVEDWVNALFLQKVELKSDPTFVNEAFRVQIPDKKTQEKDDEATSKSLDTVSTSEDFQTAALNIYNIPQNKITLNEIRPIGQAYNTPYNTNYNQNSNYNEDLTYSTTTPLEEGSLGGAVSFVDEAESTVLLADETQNTVSFKGAIENIKPKDASNEVYRLSATVETAQTEEFQAQAVQKMAPIMETNPSKAQISTPASEEQLARNNFVRAKRIIKENGDPYNALKLYDEALRLVENSNDENLKAAIYFERGRVFDDYDYAEYALESYNNATKCSDNNLKTHAHINMGRIYDDYVMFDPAIQHYSIAVETSEEAKNPAGKTKALRYLAGLFADRYDKENTEIFNALSIDAARETGNLKTIAKTMMEAAENFEYIGEDIKALSAYKEAAKALFDIKDFSALSANYEAASDIMTRLGNEAKAMSLLSKALLYRQKAELQTA